MAGLCVVAQLVSSAAVAADAADARGKELAYTCLGCHGIAGYRNAYPSYRVPKLGGQHPEYILSALKAYRSGEREHPTMRAQAASLSDQDMQDIANYFAGYGELPTPNADAKAPAIAATCTACHGADGVSLSPEWPNLAGQHRDYLVDGLRQYQANTVSERKNAIMRGLVVSLTDADVKALAAYYANQPGLFTTVD